MSPVFKMTERDGEILLSVYKHRLLTVSQIRRLHFPSMQTAYRRTRLLRSEGLLEALKIPSIEESVFSIGRKGISEVARLLGVEVADLRRTDTKSRPRDYYFMRHFLAINDFRITLSLACQSSEISLLGFIPDYYGQRTKSGGTVKYIKDMVCDIEANRKELSHTPDGVFALKRAGNPALFFLEIDRGTEKISDPDKGVLKALRFYIKYLLSGKYGRYAGEFRQESFKGFRVLFVTTSDIRIKNIRQAVTSLSVPDKAKRFVWLTTFEKIDESGLFTPIWSSADLNDSNAYRIG